MVNEIPKKFNYFIKYAIGDREKKRERKIKFNRDLLFHTNNA